MNVRIDVLLPGGIRASDHWHRGTNDDTCSRCRTPIGEDEVPLLLWSSDGEDLLIYCRRCLGWPADRADEPIRMDDGPACERCGCTEASACPAGCAWHPVFLAGRRHICTECALLLALPTAADVVAECGTF